MQEFLKHTIKKFCALVRLFFFGILFFFGCSEVNTTWLITSELANQRARKVLFSCVVYTNKSYCLRKPGRWSKIGVGQINSYFIIDRLGGLTNKNNKVCSSSVLVQEIRDPLSITPSGPSFSGKFDPNLTTSKNCQIQRTKFVLCT